MGKGGVNQHCSIQCLMFEYSYLNNILSLTFSCILYMQRDKQGKQQNLKQYIIYWNKSWSGQNLFKNISFILMKCPNILRAKKIAIDFSIYFNQYIMIWRLMNCASLSKINFFWRVLFKLIYLLILEFYFCSKNWRVAPIEC